MPKYRATFTIAQDIAELLEEDIKAIEFEAESDEAAQRFVERYAENFHSRIRRAIVHPDEDYIEWELFNDADTSIDVGTYQPPTLSA